MSSVFISFDGVDGCGKSTQTRLLASWFESRQQPVMLVREPGGTPLGESLREILLHRTEISINLTAEMLLYMASRAQLAQEVISPALQRGCHVISDRYLLASVVYQGSAGGLDPQAIWSVGRVATAGCMPDITFLLDIDPANAFGRLKGKLDRMESRGLEYMQRVREGFLREVKSLGDRYEIIDAMQPVETIHATITNTIERRFRIAV